MYLSSSHRTHSKLLISRYSRSAREHETVDPTSIPHATGTNINETQSIPTARLLLFLALMSYEFTLSLLIPNPGAGVT